MTLIITLIICLVVSFLFTFLAKKLNSSSVVGLIVGGIILGSPFVKSIILEPNTDFILMLGDFGFFALMFIAGMEISWCLLYEERKEAMVKKNPQIMGGFSKCKQEIKKKY